MSTTSCVARLQAVRISPGAISISPVVRLNARRVVWHVLRFRVSECCDAGWRTTKRWGGDLSNDCSGTATQ